MRAELVMVGTELLLGQIVDTNASFMGQVLAENGIGLYQKTTVGDNPERIKRVLDEALHRADAVLVSGGLGPTEDDITRECVAELLGRKLVFHQELLDHITTRFARFRRPLTDNNRRQAFVPEGATPIENPHGTAPGLIVEDARGIIICMPGVPSELKPMLTDRVIPYLRRRFGLTGVIHSRVLKVCGVGESRVDAIIGDLIRASDNPTIGLLASLDAVRIRITARADSVADADRLIEAMDAQVRSRLPNLVVGVDDETIETVVAGLLATRGWTIAVADAQTGGAVIQRLAAAGGRSIVGGLTLPVCGEPDRDADAAATALAEQARSQFGATCGLGVTPCGEGTACVAFLSPDGVTTWRFGFPGSEESSRIRISVLAFEALRRRLLGIEVSEP